jgi:hypothetical protein
MTNIRDEREGDWVNSVLLFGFVSAGQFTRFNSIKSDIKSDCKQNRKSDEKFVIC